MKSLLILIMLLLSGNIFSQVLKLQGTANKTTSIVFPADIIHVDLGLMDDNIGVEIDPKVANLLKLRLSKNFTTTTNMLVVTKDDNIYSFDIEYVEKLDKYVYIIKLTDAVTAKAIEKKKNEISRQNDMTKKDSINIITRIEGEKTTLTRTDIAKKNKMVAYLKNIYTTQDNKLYFDIYVSNKSNLGYIIDFHNVYMTTSSKKLLKETASQDIQVPSILCKKIKEIKAHSNLRLIIQMDKFTLEDDKICIFELYEKDGGRHLRLKISNTELLSSTPL